MGVPLFYLSGALFWVGLVNTVLVGLFAVFIYFYLVGPNKIKLPIALLLPLPWCIYYYIGLTDRQTLEQLFLYSSFIGYYVGALIAIAINIAMKKLAKSRREAE